VRDEEEDEDAVGTEDIIEMAEIEEEAGVEATEDSKTEDMVEEEDEAAVEVTEEDEAVGEDTGSGITGTGEMGETSPPEITEDTEVHPIPGVTFPVDLDSVYSILL